ncbi:MAG: 4-hydroxybenzoyl-CoA thioesterase [Gemmatimonadetes bacterium]|nr:4-hydroxybenzoyl-CoA thioesterase [Gemmatimonadota bacterium]
MPTSEHRTQRRIEFHETDMAGIVHFSWFNRYMEEAEHDFYRSIGFDLPLQSFEIGWGLPRVHAECDYHNPARFEDLLDLRLVVEELRERVVTYRIEFSRLDGEHRTPIATGRLVVCCVTRNPEGTELKATAFPRGFRERVRAVVE